MSELMKTILSLSLSGTLLILFLFLFRPLYANRLSKRWQYYIWLLAIARLLLPVTIQTNLMGNLFRQTERAELFQTAFHLPGGINPSETDTSMADGVPSDKPNNPVREESEIAAEDDANNTSTLSETTSQNSSGTSTDTGAMARTIATLWLIVFLVLLVRKITVYQSFIKYVKAGNRPVEDITLLECFGRIVAQNRIRGKVELYTNGLVSSPLLIGFVHPYIILPDTNLSEDDFYYTILHELTHYKRGDMFYKWLVQFTICLHWFNPFAYLMGHEVNRLCELSCDERIIRTLPENARISYGNTLLNAMSAGGSYRNTLASVTLNESKELLKGRLNAIMKYRKKTIGILITTVMVTCLLACGAVSLGAYATSDHNRQNSQPEDKNIPRTADKAGNDNAILVYDESTGYYTYTDTALNYTIVYKDNIYRILADGATMEDCPSGDSAGYGSLLLTLVYKDSYYSFLFDSFDAADTITEEVSQHCNRLITENQMTKEQAKLMAAATERIIKFMGQDIRKADSPKQDTSFNPSGAKSTINADGRFAYTQNGYFQNPYIIELGWNLSEKAQDAYESTEITLTDGPTLPVFFDKACKQYMSDPEALSAICALLTRLYAIAEQADTQLPIETPFIVSMEYIGDKLNDTDLYTLAKNYYEHDKLTYFTAIFLELDEQTQQEYLERQFTSKDLDFFVCSIGALTKAGIGKDVVDHYILRAYLEDDIDFFAVLSGFLDEESRMQWIDRCRQDDNIDYLYLLPDDNRDAGLDYVEDDENYLSDMLEDEGLLEEYKENGITTIKNDYYYRGKRVRILIDIRSDGSIENFGYNERGTDDIRIWRDDKGDITVISYLNEHEADEILRDLDIDPDDSYSAFPLDRNGQ